MHNGTLESLLDQAKKLEKKYEWLQAAELYKKASHFALDEEDILKATALQEKVGFCFYKAAMQAVDNRQFRNRMKLAVRSYEKTSKILQKVSEKGKKPRILHTKALTAYANSWLETDLTKKAKLLDEWWKLENELLNIYKVEENSLKIGKVCNDLLQGSQEYRYWIASEWADEEGTMEELLNLGEKAIAVLSSLNKKYELARAYCWTSLYCSLAIWSGVSENRKEELRQKSLDYSKEALVLSEKTGDSWLISWSYHSIAFVQLICTRNMVNALEYSEKALKQAKITKDHYLMALGNFETSLTLGILKTLEEDPEKQRKGLKKTIELAQNAIDHFHTIAFYAGLTFQCYKRIVDSLHLLAVIETKLETKHSLLEKAVEVGREGYEHTEGRSGRYARAALAAYSKSLLHLSLMEKEVNKKKQFLEEALKYNAEEIEIQQGKTYLNFDRIETKNRHILIQAQLAEIETNKEKKIILLNKALVLIDEIIKLIKKDAKTPSGLGWKNNIYGLFCYNILAGILEQLYSINKDAELLDRIIGVYDVALENFAEADVPSRMAETYWQIAKVYDRQGIQQKASQDYEFAAKTYHLATQKIPQLKELYGNLSLYMMAWNHIEQAKYNHSIEEYEEARQHYKKAAKLHESTDQWKYLAPNYLAWANMEEAEDLSRRENTQQAKQTFQKALGQFGKAEESIKQKFKEISVADEKEMIQKLLKASDLRRKYCQARVLMEEAKLLDREGKDLESSKSYGEAAQNISAIVGRVDVEAERKELEYIAILCRAWEKMATAEETTSSESYLDAARLFEQAKDLCFTQKGSLWALGNSSFCKGLAAKNKFQSTFEKSYHVIANKHVKQAADYYKRGGFKTASEYAKATQRLFDAYVYMNSAEEIVDPEKKAKYYQLAEQLLQLSAGLFIKAKQPEKSIQVKEILVTVREEKALATSLNQVMQAPAITSSTLSFTAPSPTNEVSVGLESFEHANVQANLITAVRQIRVGESFCLSIEFVNAGKESALLTRVEDFVPHDFVVVKKPQIYRIEDGTLNMKGKQLAPLKLVEVKLTLQPSKKGKYQLNPKVHYLDEVGQNKSLQLKTLEIKVEEVHLEDRVTTGTKELDSLLLGGIPHEYAVVLTGSPSDEREYLIKNFLKAGTNAEETTFFVSTEAEGIEHLLENSSFYLFLCNPKPKTQVPDLSNVFKLRSKTDLTNLSISLAKAYRNIDPSRKKRICVEIVSDVLISHKAETTRRWISEFITDLGAKGFTMLAVMDPEMHTTDQSKAVLNLFDGEIEITQTEDTLECKKSIRVKKLRNQDYIKNPICLT